jgi:hypothetical protein
MLREPTQSLLCSGKEPRASLYQLVANMERVLVLLLNEHLAQQASDVESMPEAEQGRPIRALGIEEAIEDEVPQTREHLGDGATRANAGWLLAPDRARPYIREVPLTIDAPPIALGHIELDRGNRLRQRNVY